MAGLLLLDDPVSLNGLREEIAISVRGFSVSSSYFFFDGSAVSLQWRTNAHAIILMGEMMIQKKRDNISVWQGLFLLSTSFSLILHKEIIARINIFMRFPSYCFLHSFSCHFILQFFLRFNKVNYNADVLGTA